MPATADSVGYWYVEQAPDCLQEEAAERSHMCSTK